MERIDVDENEVFAALADQPSPIQPKRLEALIREGDPILDRRPLQRVKSEISEISPRDTWPEPPGPEAFIGLTGEVVSLASDFSESDPVAILAHFLAAFGNIVGPNPHLVLGATKHGCNLFLALAGRTAKSRKTDSWQPIKLLTYHAAAPWADHRVAGGLASGEGLIWAVRDAEDGEKAPDRRLMVIEPEFGRVLKVMSRQGSILSMVIREAWDGGTLRTMSKNNPAISTGAHISIVGHITMEELRRDLDDVSTANGFANRFIWLAVRRSKELPIPGVMDASVIASVAVRFAGIVAKAREVGRVSLSPEAEVLWREIYHRLTADDEGGLVGGVLSRSETQVLRLALVYALLDGRDVIEPKHIIAGDELIGYCARSVRQIFGNASGDPVADLIIAELARVPRLNRTNINNLLGRHESTSRITHALRSLEDAGRAVKTTEPSGGRPVEWWSEA